jgi:Glycosyltransferase family 87
MTLLRFQRLGIACLLAFTALNMSLLWQTRGLIFEGWGDFTSFYTAGKIVRSGQSARLYDTGVQWQVQQEFASKVKIRRGPLPYVRPPFEALLFLPLAYLTYPAACVVWMIFKVALLLTLPFVLPPANDKGGKLGTHALQSLMCLAFFPVGFDLLLGQDSILLLFILAVALRLMLQGDDLQSGAVMALGLFKFHLILPLLLIFALRKRGRIVVGFAAMAGCLFSVSLGMVGWSGVVNYPRYLWRLSSLPGSGLVRPQSMPNLRGLLTVLLGIGSLSRPLYWLLMGVAVLGVVIAARAWRGHDRATITAAFSFSIVVILVTSFYANSYDLALLLLPLLLIGKPLLEVDRGWSRALFLAAAAVLLCTSLLWVLVLRVDQFCWIALALLALAASILGARKTLLTSGLRDSVFTGKSGG